MVTVLLSSTLAIVIVPTPVAVVMTPLSQVPGMALILAAVIVIRALGLVVGIVLLPSVIVRGAAGAVRLGDDRAQGAPGARRRKR
jgi:hypothetical protein